MAGAKKAPVVPRQTAEQRRQALQKANATRSSRAQLKKELAAGSMQIDKIVAAPPEFAKTQRLAVLLLCVPGYGRTKVARLLTRIGISDSKTLAGLSERQRGELIRYLKR